MEAKIKEMEKENRYCGECAYFTDESIDGIGECALYHFEVFCSSNACEKLIEKVSNE